MLINIFLPKSETKSGLVSRQGGLQLRREGELRPVYQRQEHEAEQGARSRSGSETYGVLAWNEQQGKISIDF